MTEDPDRVVIRDKRKIDPVTGQARPVDETSSSSTGEAGPPATEPGEEPTVAASLLDERTADLQRLQAEYANYRKRADRERLAAGEVAIARVVADLLPVLDNIDRARAHEDLTGGLKAVADQLDDIFGKLGLRAFGEVGDPFDPSIHEAVMHSESDEVAAATCTMIMRPGYQLGERLLRPAMVGVSEPAAPTPAGSDDTAPEGDEPPAQDAGPAQP